MELFLQNINGVAKQDGVTPQINGETSLTSINNFNDLN
jgi:hypothetical protein